MDLQFAVMGGNWNGPESTTDDETAGNAAWPRFELRDNAGGKLGEVTCSAYLVAASSTAPAHFGSRAREDERPEISFSGLFNF
jgi:hypothetical protein